MALLIALLACTGEPDGPTTDDSIVTTDDSRAQDDTGEVPAVAGEDLGLFTSSAVLKVYLNSGSAVPEDVNKEISIGKSEDWTALADFDGDGLDDFWQMPSGSNKVRIWMNEGSATFSEEHQFDPLSGAGTRRPAVAGDFTGDGADDILMFNTNNDKVIVYPNVIGQFDVEDGKISADTSLGGSGDWASGDFDGDGTDDLIQLAGSDVTIWRVSEGLIDESAPLHQAHIPGAVQALGLDLDDDGDAELCTWSGSTLSIFLNEGDALSAQATEVFLNSSGFVLAGELR
jgi:hypothetical protein